MLHEDEEADEEGCVCPSSLILAVPQITDIYVKRSSIVGTKLRYGVALSIVGYARLLGVHAEVLTMADPGRRRC